MRNEQIIISWIDGSEQPPQHLASEVARYRQLAALRDTVTGERVVHIDHKMDAIFDRLVVTAPSRSPVKPAKQLRRLQRRDEAHMTLTQRWAAAIAGAPAALNWGYAE